MSLDRRALAKLLSIDLPEGKLREVLSALCEEDGEKGMTAADRRKEWDRNRKRAEAEAKRSAVSTGKKGGIPPETSSPSSPNEINLTPTTPTSTSLRSVSVKSAAEKAFHELFWSVYPRKVGKDAAKKVFVRIIVSGRSTVEIVMAGARSLAVRSLGKDAEFIPHPATWLNAGRFDDEEPVNGVAAARPTMSGVQVGAGIWLRRDDPRFEAWAAYKKALGKPQAVDGNGGWLFPSERPPDELKKQRQAAPQLEFSG